MILNTLHWECTRVGTWSILKYRCINIPQHLLMKLENTVDHVGQPKAAFQKFPVKFVLFAKLVLET